PIFSNIILADEINRTPTKTQAALLEAMEEGQVTIQGETYLLPEVIIVVATQNPIEFEGTYTLPEAQQERLLFKLMIDFPEIEEEIKVLKRVLDFSHTDEFTETILNLASFQAIQKEIEAVTINDDVLSYIMQIVRKTRETESIQFGASTRAAIAIAKTAKAWAYLSERNYVTPDDVKMMAKPALRHRIQISPQMELEGVSLDQIIEELVGAIPVPR